MARRLAAAALRRLVAGVSVPAACEPNLTCTRPISEQLWRKCAAAGYGASSGGVLHAKLLAGAQPAPATRSFASDADNASAGLDFDDFVSYPAPRAYVGQPAPDWEAPGVLCLRTSRWHRCGVRLCCSPGGPTVGGRRSSVSSYHNNKGIKCQCRLQRPMLRQQPHHTLHSAAPAHTIPPQPRHL